MLNSDDLCGPANEQLFTAQSKPLMIPEANTHTVYTQNKSNIVYCMFIASYF